MSFVNLQVQTEDLPGVETLNFEPMSAVYRKEVKVQLAIVFLPLLIASFIPLAIVQALPLLLIPVGILLLAIAVSYLALGKAKVKGLALRDHDVAYRHGLFWRKTVLLPFNRIQHVEVSSGPLQRKYGLATLKFFTAGGSSVDLKVDGLTEQRAEQIRSLVTAKAAGQSTE
ncbi:MAG: PH domain-containing protein [Gammaproteobacteria bacterium]|nr:PH domain-containing protein [Gammaproteobacteria bacterium]